MRHAERWREREEGAAPERRRRGAWIVAGGLRHRPRSGASAIATRCAPLETLAASAKARPRLPIWSRRTRGARSAARGDGKRQRTDALLRRGWRGAGCWRFEELRDSAPRSARGSTPRDYPGLFTALIERDRGAAARRPRPAHPYLGRARGAAAERRSRSCSAA